MKAIFRNGQVWQTDHFVPVDVAVNGSSIQRVGSSLPTLPDYQEIDISGKYLLPGIIDCHWHLGMVMDDPQTRVYYDGNAIE